MVMAKFPAIFLVLILASASGFAQSRPNVDTLSILGVRAAASSTPVTLSSFDTMFWNATLGVGMLQKKGTLYGHSGEFRVGVGNSTVTQVSFSIGAKNKDDAAKIYTDVIGQLHNQYGDPDANVTTDPPEIRWEGMEQFFAVRMAAQHDAVNIVISKFEQH
jgi:hypothetical protein